MLWDPGICPFLASILCEVGSWWSCWFAWDSLVLLWLAQVKPATLKFYRKATAPEESAAGWLDLGSFLILMRTKKCFQSWSKDICSTWVLLADVIMRLNSRQKQALVLHVVTWSVLHGFTPSTWTKVKDAVKKWEQGEGVALFFISRVLVLSSSRKAHQTFPSGAQNFMSPPCRSSLGSLLWSIIELGAIIFQGSRVLLHQYFYFVF